MASKNSIRHYDSHAYYHIYNRGVEKRKIFLDDQDSGYFIHILKRHLDGEVHKDKSGRPYRKHEDIDLLAYCLMPNHYHLLIYQGEDTVAFTKLIRSVATAYSHYFNKKYGRVGHLFQDRFKASRVDNDAYLAHISRYIHLNPANPFGYKWSSLSNYVKPNNDSWVKSGKIIEQFTSSSDYVAFVNDYKSYKSDKFEMSTLFANQ